MKTPLRIILLFLSIINIDNSFAQLQKVDTTFATGAGPNSIVRQIDIQSSGKIILTGEFNVFKGTLANRITRLNIDGTVDTSFKSGFGSEGPIRATALQPDDKIIIGGLFNNYNNVARKNIVRLNANGTLDTSFAKGLGANNEITSAYLQHDGKILISGFFGKYDNTFLNGFVRLTSNGSIDTSFNMGTGPSISPNDFAQQSNHKIIIVGSFLFYNGTPRNKIVRANLDGTLDTTFKNNSISNTIQKVLILKNDEIVITGGFTNIDGVTKTGIAKLSKDGKLDTSFNAFILGTVRGLYLQKDGKIIVSGDFTNVNGVAVQRIARLNPDGTLDNSFYAGFNGSVYDIAEQSDRKILLGGNYTQVTEVPTKTRSNPRIVRLENQYCLAPSPAIFFDTHAHACKGDIVQIKIDSGELNDAKNWYWYLDTCGGTAIDSGSSIQVQVNRNAKYYVRAEQYCSNLISTCSEFEVFMNDTMTNAVSIVGNYMIADQSNVSYQWYNCDSIPYAISGETRQAFEPLFDGKYSVQLVSVDSCVVMSDCISFVVPILIGINQNKKILISNPVSDKIILPADKQLKNLSVYNNLGQKLIQLNITEAVTEVNIEELAVGVYLLKANDVYGNVYSERFVIRR